MAAEGSVPTCRDPSDTGNKKAGRIVILPALLYFRHAGGADRGRSVIGDPKRQQQRNGSLSNS
jgi:hypothetical protein